MAIIKKIGDGYYLCKKKRGLYRGNHNVQEKFISIFKVKASSYKTGCKIQVNRANIYFPQEFFGKKIMLKVIIVEDKKQFKFEDLESAYG